MPLPPPPAETIRAVVETYKANGFNAVRTAEAVGKPVSTVKEWLKQAKRNGWLDSPLPPPPPDPVELPERESKPRVRVTVGRPEGAVCRVLAIGDAHDAPDLPKDRFRWMGRHAAAIGADYVVSIGDFLTLDSLNGHIPNESLLGKQKTAFSRDMQSAKEALGEFDRGLGAHRPSKRITSGNHERRAWHYEEMRPEVAGILTGELLTTFEDHGWGWTPYGEYFFLNGVGFIHCAINRLNKSYGGKNAEVTVGNDAVFDHVIGHSHVRREHRAIKLGPSKHVTILNLGCSLPWGHVESYMLHGALTGWWWGCHELLIQNGQITDVNAVSMLELERRYS